MSGRDVCRSAPSSIRLSDDVKTDDRLISQLSLLNARAILIENPPE
jgi:hypothetical protein